MIRGAAGGTHPHTQWADNAVTQAAEKKSRYYSLLYTQMAERQRAEEHLRHSNALLMALGEVQLRFVSGAPLPALYADLLAALLAVTQSEYGLIGEVVYTEAQQPRCEVHAIQDQGADEMDRSGSLVKLIDRVLTTGKSVIVDERHDDLLAQYPPLTPNAPRTLLGVPFYTGETMVGVLALANRPGGFSTDIITFLQPVLSTCAQLITAHRNEQRRKAAELALAEERASLAQRVAERTAELRLANAELTRAVRAKDEFLATINHELRTPLNAILLFSEILHRQMHGTLNERQLRAVSGIEESGNHLLTLINDILDVAKIEAGKLVLDLAPCSVEGVCQASLRLVAEMANRKGISISLHLDPAVTELEADERRLKQMLVNLLSNAVKFTHAGGAVGLEVAGDRAQNLVRFTVWDTGIGIPREQIDNLFKPFVQLDSGHTRQFGGTGLGLVLVYRMAKMHSGDVSVESEVDNGSRFTITLPWVREACPSGAATVSAPVVEPAARPDPVSAPQHHPPVNGTQPPDAGASQAVADPRATPAPLILLAEDNAANVAALSEFLYAQNYRLIVAGNGKEAVAKARLHRPDLILMDVQMPEMDGLEAARRLRMDAELAHLPIVALTAMVMPGDRERCMASGVDGVLGKPIRLDKLAEVLELYLRQPCTPQAC